MAGPSLFWSSLVNGVVLMLPGFNEWLLIYLVLRWLKVCIDSLRSLTLVCVEWLVVLRCVDILIGATALIGLRPASRTLVECFDGNGC